VLGKILIRLMKMLTWQRCLAEEQDMPCSAELSAHHDAPGSWHQYDAYQTMLKTFRRLTLVLRGDRFAIMPSKGGCE
jgi:hypothetical protein